MDEHGPQAPKLGERRRLQIFLLLGPYEVRTEVSRDRDHRTVYFLYDGSFVQSPLCLPRKPGCAVPSLGRMNPADIVSKPTQGPHPHMRRLPRGDFAKE
jgi:hypothetical protein